MDRQPHNNLWAEKLLQVSMPDSGEAWAGMEAILDRQMPQRSWSDWRRWLLVILLLLLLIGVCNCPGRGRLFHSSEHGPRITGANTTNPAKTDAGVHTPGGSGSPEIPANPATPSSSAATPASPAAPGATTSTPLANPAAPAPVTPATPGAPTSVTPATPTTPSISPATPTASTPGNLTSAKPASPGSEPTIHAKRRLHSSPLPPASVTARKHHLPGATDSATRPNRHKVTASLHTPRRKQPALTPTPSGGPTPAAPRKAPKPRTASRGASRPPTAFGDITQTAREGSSVAKTSGRQRPPANRTGKRRTSTTATGDTTTIVGNDTTRSNNPRRGTATKKNVTVARDTTARKRNPILAKAIPRKDILPRKPPPEDLDDKEGDHGWVFGIGLNQFFPIGGQKGSTYNTDGLTGTLSDYLPVPMIRYYLNHKAYLQVEAQLNTPQATKKNLVFNSPISDSLTIGGQRDEVSTSATLQQLYYFNIPLSFHYEVRDNLNIGAGLQFSHLSNAIGSFDSTLRNLTTNEITNPKDTKSFKDDTLFQRIRTNEFRFLIDANYTWKNIVVGLRYNQALSRFIDLQLPTGGSTQSRNSSLQLYLRYIILDTRKKMKLKITITRSP